MAYGRETPGKYRGWKIIGPESLGSVGPGTLWVMRATKKDRALSVSLTSNHGAPREELRSMIRASIRKVEDADPENEGRWRD